MKRRYTTYWKAAFLLLVFSLNTVLSFACSLSTVFHDLQHRSGTAATPGHEHSAVASHHHYHKHSQGTFGQGHASKKAPENDCCSGSIVRLEKVDKAASAPIKAPAPALERQLIETLYLLSAVQQVPEPAYPVYCRWRPPGTIHDLRITIQSFQI
ncbi:MAG: hypothetical protein EOO11_09275 [Chitinophagaceae bacterium]|nr:MAG: hypothetical protein EOO11_09275 [Chitinophagaceae bacterium]